MKDIYYVTDGNGQQVAVYCTPEEFAAATHECTAPDCKTCLVPCPTRAIL